MWKYARKRLWTKLLSLIKMIWRKGSERLEEKHSSSYILYKRGDQEKANYKGISLLKL